MIPYVPADRLYAGWYRQQLDQCTGRNMLRDRLRHIRARHGSAEAKQFRDWMLWLGTYPVRLRRALPAGACPVCGFSTCALNPRLAAVGN